VEDRHVKPGAVGRPASVERLIVLPLKKSVEISLKSLKVRFFRSLILTMSLVLAVSFLGLLQALTRAGYDVGSGVSSLGSSPKQRWIIILSLLVCVVGIVNAQLMAVTERFREIGTMKCLGALDRFILRLFLLEAGMEGLAGGFVGATAGTLFSLVNSMLSFGTVAVTSLSWMDVFLSIVFATGAGFLLSLIGVIYPAILAARMQPVEAMRVEQ
jgi:ABC-type antimicrobial peptide transport system permease subunit